MSYFQSNYVLFYEDIPFYSEQSSCSMGNIQQGERGRVCLFRTIFTTLCTMDSRLILTYLHFALSQRFKENSTSILTQKTPCLLPQFFVHLTGGIVLIPSSIFKCSFNIFLQNNWAQHGLSCILFALFFIENNFISFLFLNHHYLPCLGSVPQIVILIILL